MTQLRVVNRGLSYIDGFTLTNDGTTHDEIVVIASGQCRDSGNEFDIVADSSLSVDITNSGVNGLDTGSVAADTFYAVYVIGDSSGFKDTAGILSTDGSSPSLPFGYDVYRRVGYVLTDGSSDILKFDQRGNGSDRTVVYRSAIATDVTAGSSSSWAAVDVSGSIPVASCMGLFRVAFDPTAGDDTLFLRSGDSGTDAPQATISGSAAGVTKTGNLLCPVGDTLASGIDYEVIGDAVAIDVQGYVDHL